MLNHLILNTPWLDVRKSILNLYPDQESMIEKFEDVYALLKTLTFQQSGIRIYLEGQSKKKDGQDGEIEVFGIEASNTKNGKETYCPLDDFPWEHWLGMKVDKRTMTRFSDADIVAHCLWEMTFWGFEQETVRREFAEMLRKADEFEKMKPQMRKKHFTQIGKVKGYTIWVADDVIDKME